MLVLGGSNFCFTSGLRNPRINNQETALFMDSECLVYSLQLCSVTCLLVVLEWMSERNARRRACLKW
jgi:hypothetical protein